MKLLQREELPTTTLPIERPVTQLRQRLLDNMAMRALRSRTQHDYVRHVRAYAAFVGCSPETATAEEVRRFQLHQRDHGAGAPTINSVVSALQFLFGMTLHRPDLSRRLVLAPSQQAARRAARRGGGAAALIEVAPPPCRLPCRWYRWLAIKVPRRQVEWPHASFICRMTTTAKTPETEFLK